MIQRKCKFIVIDEIDISLDASAQVNLINELRKFCKDYQVNITFTTHSLALMKTLIDPELCYMGNSNGIVTFERVSYNYAKSILFGFQGWDKYILTEDAMLESYITHLLSQIKGSIYFKYKIIYIGGGANVVSLMNRNKTEQFLSSPENVIGVLDGDQNKNEARLAYCKNNDRIKFIPFQSVEKQLKEHYENENRDGLPIVSYNNNGSDGDIAKRIYEQFIKTTTMTDTDIFSFINERKTDEVEKFKMELIDFLTINMTDGGQSR
jgi:ABC-type multidrug transport system ATPase subunit